jgi:hypothetical protein
MKSKETKRQRTESQKTESQKTGGLTTALADRFMDIWRLLSETNFFLSRTPEFHYFEEQLRILRRELQAARKDSAKVQEVRSKIIDIRRNLRLMGYDLSLGKQNLIIDKFRNDACMAEGFRRVVLFFTRETILYLAGEENHIELSSFLSKRLEQYSTEGKQIFIRDKHYLWYRRQGVNLVLSGSDTETKEDFERLKAMGEVNSLFILSSLKQLR